MSLNKTSVTQTIPIPNDIEDIIKSVMVQTNYSREESLLHLKAAKYDKVLVIMNFVKGDNCDIYSSTPTKYSQLKLSPHQEVYRQIRYKMNDAMRGYNKKIDVHEEKNKTSVDNDV
jgi:hypothetical protein